MRLAQIYKEGLAGRRRKSYSGGSEVRQRALKISKNILPNIAFILSNF